MYAFMYICFNIRFYIHAYTYAHIHSTSPSACKHDSWLAYTHTHSLTYKHTHTNIHTYALILPLRPNMQTLLLAGVHAHPNVIAKAAPVQARCQIHMQGCPRRLQPAIYPCVFVSMHVYIHMGYFRRLQPAAKYVCMYVCMYVCVDR